jgi:hypothetical protein
MGRAVRRRRLQVTFPDRIHGRDRPGLLGTRRILKELATSGEGVSELIVHPALAPNEYHRRWRYAGADEVRALLSDKTARALRACR